MKKGVFPLLPTGYHLPQIPSSVFAFQESEKGTRMMNSQLSVGIKDCPVVFGNKQDKMQPTSHESLLSEQFMIYQNIVNENRLKQSKLLQTDNLPNITLRKNGRKQNRAKRTLRQVVNDILANSPYRLPQRPQRGHQEWNHVPRMDWIRSNSQAYANFLASLRSGTITTRGVNIISPPLSTRREFTNTSYNSSDSSKTSSRSRVFKTRNPFYNDFEINENKAGNMERITRSKSSTTNSRNPSKCNKLNQEDDDDDVTYLFSVDPSPDETVVLEIDLQSKTTNLIPNKSSANSKNPSKHNKLNQEEDDITYLFDVNPLSEEKIVLGADLQLETTNLVPDKKASKPIILEKESRTDVLPAKKPKSAVRRPKSRKRKTSSSENKESKRSSNQPRCTMCVESYADIVGRNGNMYISTKCSDVFCQFCIYKNGIPKTCPTCGARFLSFRRLFLQ